MTVEPGGSNDNPARGWAGAIQRSAQPSFFSFFPLLSPLILATLKGPIAGGAMADVGFWREIYWLNCAM